MGAVAGVCDPSGRIFGLMPHPERFVTREQHPNWRRQCIGEPQGLPFFVNAINFAQRNL
jgi:phosphoribosylformylglycinamidine synthase